MLKSTVFTGFILVSLLTVCVPAYAEPDTIPPTFLESNANIMFAHGQSLYNHSGENLFILNRKQFDVLYDIWIYARDEEGFKGKEMAILNDFESYIEKTDTMLVKLGGNMDKSKTLADSLKVDYEQVSFSTENTFNKLEKISSSLEKTANAVGKNTEELIRKNKGQRMFIKVIGYGLAITGGILLGQMATK